MASIAPLDQILDTIEFNCYQPTGFDEHQRRFWEKLVKDELEKHAAAQLALADKVIQAARKHFHWAGGRGHHVACNYPDDTAPRCNCGSNDLRTALAEYDKERAAP